MILFDSRIPADMLALSALRKEIGARLSAFALGENVRNAILLTVAEMGANAIRHSDPAPLEIGVRLRLAGPVLELEIEDDGGAFEGYDACLAQSVLREANLYAESGRGLSMLRRSLDDMRYLPGPPNIFCGRKVIDSASPTLLIVEDSPILLETYSAMLSDRYQIARASSLASAVNLLRDRRIDAIVTDLHLEGRQGSELVDILEADIERPPVPVLVLTGERDPACLRRVLQSGVEQVLPKPVSGEALSNAVAAMIARNARQNARLFRYFNGSIDQEGELAVPERIGPFQLRAIGARAAFGRGDFLCVMRARGGRRIVVADVMGHGLLAQVAGMRFKAAIRGIHGADPDRGCGAFLTSVSRALAREPVLPDSFLTLMVVDLLADGTIEIAAAGHPRAFIADAEGSRMVATDGPLPGMFEEADYPVERLVLAPGERLYVPTDGIDPMAPDAGRVLPDWLGEAVRAVAGEGFPAALDALDNRIRSVLTHAPIDDWTLLAIERPNFETQALDSAYAA